MDAFFASIEQRDNPDWKRKPLIVGAKPGNRGVVSAAPCFSPSGNPISAVTPAGPRLKVPRTPVTIGEKAIFKGRDGLSKNSDCLNGDSQD